MEGQSMTPETPAEHYQKAVDLLNSVEGHNEGLPFVKTRIARAHVHALLAQVKP